MPKPNKAAVQGGATVNYITGRDASYGFSSVPTGDRRKSRVEFFRVDFVADEDAPDGFRRQWTEIGAVTKTTWDTEWSVASVTAAYQRPEVEGITGRTAKATVEAIVEEIESWA